MIEPDFVVETLSWCNSIRVAKGLEELERLPRGRRNDPKSCPCGLVTGLHVGLTTYGENFSTSVNKLPFAVSQFISEFDEGYLPQYDEDPEFPEFEGSEDW